MKQLFGIPQNIDELLLGRITYKNSFFKAKSDLVFVTKNGRVPSGFKAVLTNQDVRNTKNRKIVKCVQNIEELREKDIVTVGIDGSINVVYEINSNHNSIFITEKCNSNCIMCPQPPVKHEEDKFEFNLKLIQLIDKKTKTLGITGGEPTILDEKLILLIDEIHKRRPKISINILTNAIRFEDYEYAKRFSNSLKSCDVVDVPLYSDIDSIHNSIVRTKTFYKTIKGIYNLAKFNVKIGIRIVVHKMNYMRLREFSEYIYSNFPFVYNIAFMQMEPIGYAKDNLSALWIDPFDYNEELQNAVLNLYFRDLNVSIYNSQLCILPEKIRHFAVQSISEWKNVYIDECEKCSLKGKCPGFFASSKNIYSRKISAIDDL